MKMTVPTLLTLFRILLIPVLIAIFYLPHQPWTNFAATFVFVLGALTDWADGWIARRWNQFSAFGAFLDPVADKLAVTTALVLIVVYRPTQTNWLPLLAIVIIGREIAISALREWMAEVGHGRKVKVAWLGKLKTIVQMTAISMLLYHDPILSLPTFDIGEVLLAVAAALTLVSGYGYLRAAWPSLQGD
ncbi:MAG TPA: CDP-diacylglycerol--glycerol-3-phosphate 3-phosphatidyltransferase [Xanthomonadaceae bacterium]|jgi:CDP-diacylglycerol--glycerol-3-phosphate 3-phosphatidyltransferase|nr:CDP-diacylglycerol--glycerol-3-phosphate 3-phosphatidyltransferase [Xanthomonadaceae bacterium]